jgi:hypothetical protein
VEHFVACQPMFGNKDFVTVTPSNVHVVCLLNATEYCLDSMIRTTLQIVFRDAHIIYQAFFFTFKMSDGFMAHT